MSALVPRSGRAVERAHDQLDARLGLALASDRSQAIRAAQRVHDIERVAEHGLAAAGRLGRAAEAEVGSLQGGAMQRAVLGIGVRAVFSIGDIIDDLSNAW